MRRIKRLVQGALLRRLGFLKRVTKQRSNQRFRPA